MKWKYKANNRIGGSPAIGTDGTLYFGSYGGSYYAINSDGTLKWQYNTGTINYASPAIADDGTLYIGSHDNGLYAFTPYNQLPSITITELMAANTGWQGLLKELHGHINISRTICT